MDDSSPKIKAVKKFLVESCSIASEDIDLATCINEGRSQLYRNNYDLLLLDLVMPIAIGTEPDKEESPKFIDEIYTNVYIHIPIHIIGFSEFEDLLDVTKDKFEDKLWHLIKFKFDQNDWKTKLMNKVQHLIRTKEMFKKSVEEKLSCDFGIICALDHEFSAMKSAFEGQCWQKFYIEGLPFPFYSVEFETINGNILKIVSCCSNQMGMQATAVVSSYMYSLFKVKTVFMTGICAGIKGKANIGDIIIAEDIFDYGSGKLITDSLNHAYLQPDYQHWPIDYDIKSSIHDFLEGLDVESEIRKYLKGNHLNNINGEIRIHTAPTACGSYVIANSAFAASLMVNERKLAGVEMEGYGLYTAGHIANKGFLMIKAVCDLADEEKNNSCQELCEYESGYFLYLYLYHSY